MPNLSSIEQWLHNHTYTGNKPLAQAQRQQTIARILLTCASLLYVVLHGEQFELYKAEALSFSAIYFILNSAALISLRRHPFGLLGSLFYPLLDVAIVTFGMLIDGGHSSGVYFMLLVIIIGNGLRFGNALLIFAQVSCLIGLFIMTAYAYYAAHLPLDPTLLFWQTFTLIAVPFYVYLIGKKLELAVEEKVHAEQASFQLIDQGPLPVFTYALDEERSPLLLYANSALYQLFQRDHHEILGKPTNTFVLPEDSEEMVKFCRSVFDHEDDEPHQPRTSYFRGRGAAGEIIKLMITTIRMRWRERWIGVCFMLDITERESLQEELEAIHRQGYMSTLVAGVVHDFRNVLTNMIGNAEVLQMNSQSEGEKAQIESIITAGERGSDLITHLLKLSRSGHQTAQSTVVIQGREMIEPLENIISLARLQLPHNTRLISRINGPLPDVTISLVEIEEILLNLINNSMQAVSDCGLIEVTIDQRHNSKHNRDELCITVADNGEGISSENLERVFKPFWTSRANKGGTGIGLTMVKRIAKLHHGSIDIRSSAEEKKTSVCVSIPAHKQQAPVIEAAQTQQPPPPVKLQTAATKPLRILLVDDMPEILKIHQAMLARLGHTALIADSADAALALFHEPEQQFDMLITDFRMPVKDGLELIEEIREVDTTIPILMITAYGEDEQLQKVGNYQVMLINKPVTLAKMTEGIAAASVSQTT